MIKLFWKTYRIKMITDDKKETHVLFMRGFTWDVVEKAVKYADKKKGKWVVYSITRVY